MNAALIIGFWLPALALLYTHVVYPELMRLAARRTARTVAPTPSRLPSVTLIIPAHNEETVLEEKLDNSLELDYLPELLEIVVASDGSSDRTLDIANDCKNNRVQLLAFAEQRGKPQTVNDAVRATHGDVVCLCDANVMFCRDALKRLVARLCDPQVGAVSGDVRLASEETKFAQGEGAYYRMERAVQLGESIVGSMMGVDGGMYVIRRELYEHVPSDTIVDDFVISMRVIRRGKRVVYEPAAIAHENATPGVRQEFKRRVRLSAGAMQVLKRWELPRITQPVALWQFASHKLLRWLGPVWLLVMFVCSGILAYAGDASGQPLVGWSGQIVYQLAFGAQVVFYLLALGAAFSARLRDTRFGGIAFYFTISHIAMALGLVKGLFNTQSVIWRRTARQPVARAAS